MQTSLPDQDSQPEASDSANGSESPDWFLRAALLLALLWFSGLIILSRSAADGVMLNVRQIAEADAIVTAAVQAKQQPGVVSLKTKRIWRGNPHELKPSLIVNQSIPNDGEFVIPLTRTARGWKVTPAPVGQGTALIYPATKQTIQQLKQQLKSPPNGGG